MNSNDNIIFLAVIIFIFYLSLPSSEVQEKTIYFTYCSDHKHNSYSCPKNERSLVMKTSFKIFPKEQLVVSNYLTKLESCTIFNKNNWQCKSKNYSESMLDGNYYSSSYAEGSLDEKNEKSPIFLDQQISALEYYIRYIIGFFR